MCNRSWILLGVCGALALAAVLFAQVGATGSSVGLLQTARPPTLAASDRASAGPQPLDSTSDAQEDPPAQHEVQATHPGNAPQGSRQIKIGDTLFDEEWDGPMQRLRFPSGHVYAESSWLDGKRTGVSRMWYDNGTLHAQGDYLDDERAGVWTYYSANGTPIESGSYDRGFRTGPWHLWYPNAVLKSEGSYMVASRGHGSVRTGRWTFYDMSGSLDPRLSGVYENDVRVSD